jgi:flagellar biosynthesis GTPase FlhF
MTGRGKLTRKECRVRSTDPKVFPDIPKYTEDFRKTRFWEWDRWFGSEFGERVLTVPPSYGQTHEAVSEIPEIAGANAYASIVLRHTSQTLPSPRTMADVHAPIAGEVDKEELVLLAALKAVQERKARILEEAEEKWRADEAAKAKRKADEVAKAKRKAEEAAKEKHKADEAEAQKLEAAEKEKAAQAQAEKEEAERIRAANEAMKVGVAAHLAEVKRTADEAAAA